MGSAQDIRGIIPAVITPFTPDEAVDEAAFRKVLTVMIDQGVHGLFPVGTGGEFFALTGEEKQRLMAVAVEVAAGRVFVMPNVGAITTDESVRLARHAESVGCDAVSAITPFFLKPSQDELFQHYRAICRAVTIPVLAYNIPERTGGVSLTPATVFRLARELPNFIGIKDSTGDLSGAAELVQEAPAGFRVFMGRDTLIYGALLHGCAGAVAASANVAPGLAVGIARAVEAGDLARGRALQAQLAPVRKLFAVGSHPAGIKEAMVQLGMLACGRCRRPTLDLTPAQKEEVRAILRRAGLAGEPADQSIRS
jgi:4-hydroxy-tetrahydrodipicolinate synthase